MNKFTLIPVALIAIFTLTACSNTVADVSTSDGGEVVVTESEVGTVEKTVDPADGPKVDAEAEVNSFTITYTDPAGYTVEESGGGAVTFKLEGYEVGKIVYVPAEVNAQLMEKFNAALEADVAQLKEYAAEFAEGLDVDYEVTKEEVNGQQAVLVTGTVAEGSAEGNPGDMAYVLVLPVGDRLVVLRGFADAETAEQVKADMMAFAGTMESTGAVAGDSVSEASGTSEASSVASE